MEAALRHYYRLPQVRARLAEFCGGTPARPRAFTCQYLVTYHREAWGVGTRHHIDEFDALLDRGADLGRSLWDSAGLVADLDLDYQNVDFPAEGVLHPHATFEKLAPAYETVAALLAELRLRHLTLISATGYHFLWRIPLRSPAFRAQPLPLELGRAFAGLGCVMEYLAHQVLWRARDVTSLPLVVAGVRVGCRATGREAISLDLSAFGDPLDARLLRCAFAASRKHHHAPGFAGTPAADLPPLVYLPRQDRALPLAALLEARADLRRAADLATALPARIPAGGSGTLHLLQRYQRSALARFHREFYAGWHDPPEAWPLGYDRLDLDGLPPCVAEPLRRPNDWLLKPTNLQTVARILWSLGWHPRDIAGLVRSKYERDHGWGERWRTEHAAARADFYVRLYCGLVAAGVDALEDLNCVSQQEKGYCPRPGCGSNLLDYRPALLGRRTP